MPKQKGNRVAVVSVRGPGGCKKPWRVWGAPHSSAGTKPGPVWLRCGGWGRRDGEGRGAMTGSWTVIIKAQ